MKKSSKKRKAEPAGLLAFVIIALCALKCSSMPSFPTFRDIPEDLIFSKHVDNDGFVTASLKKSIWVYGLPCAGGNASNSSLFVYPDNNLAGMRLHQPVVHEGIPCTGNLGFYPNGDISGTILSKDFEFYGKVWAKGTGLDFFEGSKLKRGTLAKAWDDSKTETNFPPGTKLEFFANGAFKEIAIGQNASKYHGKTYQMVILELDSMGNLIRVTEIPIPKGG
jgi:hypothetical protein